MKAALSGPRPFAIAHRGSRLLWPENTMEAFEGAHAIGLRWLETDLHATSDGVVVCLHDDDLDRTTDGSGPVSAIAFDDLTGLDAGYHHSRDGTHPYRGSGVRVPRLADVLRRFPDSLLVVDLKQDGIEEATWAVISGLDAVDRVVVGSFADRRLRRFRRVSAGAVAMSTATVATFVRWSMASAGLTPPFADALQVPVTYGPLPVLGARRVAAYHRAGSQVHVWTVNEEPVMERLLDDGVDGIITDRPDLLRAVLERRGQWTGGGRVS